ncbi:MAG: TlpA family protein disulfide reductase [Lysobacter sp.]|nr:TlpA family protein disulfide reductase [Lysobacter sp.]
MSFRFSWLCAGLAVLALAACQRNPTPAAGVQPAQKAPSATPAPTTQESRSTDTPTLRVTTVDGKAWDLAQHRGRWVVVNFWATWCGPCLKEMPELSALDAMREHVEVIGLDYEDTTPAALQAFLQKHPVVYPVAIVDVYEPPKDFASPRGLPTTYLIAPDGKVAKHFLGPVSAKDIDDAIAAAGGPKAG